MVANEAQLPLALQHANRIGLDIGGTLIKIVHYEPMPSPSLSIEHGSGNTDRDRTMNNDNSHVARGRLIFRKFEGSQLNEAILYMRSIFESKQTQERVLVATGGGAHKYAHKLTESLSAQLVKLDEMNSLIAGLTFLLASLPFESYALSQPADPQSPFTYLPAAEKPDALFPYLLVNIGSGVSILKVSSPSIYERVSGSSLGGGTFLGLCSALTRASSFDEAVALAESGDHSRVDLLVGDIYGGMDYQKIGLSRSVIASSCAKLSPVLNHYSKLQSSSSSLQNESTDPIQDADIAASLLHMICNNLGQIAYLNAQRHSVKRVIFSGFFIRRQILAMRKLSYAIDFWSRGTMSALFLRHEGYLGSLGALLQQQQQQQYPREPQSSNESLVDGEMKTDKDNIIEDVGPDTAARVTFPTLERLVTLEDQGYASPIELEWPALSC